MGVALDFKKSPAEIREWSADDFLDLMLEVKKRNDAMKKMHEEQDKSSRQESWPT